MRIALALFAFISLLCSAPALAQESEPAITGSMSAAISSEWLYRDQGFYQTENTDVPFSELTGSLCYRSTCASVWYGKAADVEETDLTLSQGFETGTTTINVQGGLFLVEGPDIWQAKVTISRQAFCNSCTASISYEVMREGFIEDVIKAELSYEGSLSNGIGIDASVGLAHSRWAGGFAVPFGVGVSRELWDNVSMRLSVKGYVSDEPQATVGVALVSGF